MALERLLGTYTVRFSEAFGDDVAPAARRGRAILARADENYQEKGLQTLFVAWGMATWTNTRSTFTPCAPILLRQARLSCPGRRGRGLRPGAARRVGDQPDPAPCAGAISTCGSTPRACWTFSTPSRAARRRGALRTPDQGSSSVAGFVDRRPGSAGQLQLRQAAHGQGPRRGGGPAGPERIDLRHRRRHRSARRSASARATCPVHAPDFTPPADEFLVLDADSSQSYAINSVVAGRTSSSTGRRGRASPRPSPT